MDVIGRVLGNRYEIIEKVGSGGMANVYKAKDRMLNRFVAIKVLHSEYKEDEEFIRRFNIESQAAASLSHQNIVQIYDVGDEDGIQYIVMEFLGGKTLKEYIKSKGGGLYWKEATDYSMQICRALEHAHQKHIIHRDIKPQNIIVTPEGILKVTDFGIARAANNNTTKMNSTAIGSAHYLSPEQARGGYTDQRSDIYSLGVVMYELFTGHLPFDAETPVAVAMKHIQEDPIPPRKLNSSIPKGIEQIILKAMSKEVRLRYSNAEEVLADLKLMYIDPENEIVETNGDNGETRVIDTREVKRRVDVNTSSVTERPRSDEAPVRRKSRKNSSAVAIWAVIVASALLIALMFTIIFTNVFGNKSSNGRNNAANEIPVPKVLGMTIDEAQKSLPEGFTISVDSYKDDEAPKDTIISQSPEADSTVSEPSNIKVVISNGPKTMELIDYSMNTYDEVEKELTGMGINIVKEEQSSDIFPSGTVIKHKPEAGSVLRTGDTVTLYVSTGSENATVPSVIGSYEEDARVLIERSGFVVGEVHRDPSKEDRGKVFDQSPKASTVLARGSKINIYVSTGSGKENNNDNDDNPDDNKQTASDPPEDNTNQVQEMKTKYLLLNLPSDRTKVTVKLICDGKVIYEKEHNTSTGTADISLKSRGTIKVDIYYDDEFVATREVVFD